MNLTVNQIRRAKDLSRDTPRLDGKDKDGTVWSRWMRAMLQYREHADDDNDFLDFVLSKTDGPPRTLVETLYDQGWDVIRERLERYYDPAGTRESALADFALLSQGTKTGKEYIEETSKLAKKLDYDLMAVNHERNLKFVGGLSSKYLRMRLMRMCAQNSLLNLMDKVFEQDKAEEFATRTSGVAINIATPEVKSPETAQVNVGRPLPADERVRRNIISRINKHKKSVNIMWCQLCDSNRHNTDDCRKLNHTKCEHCEEEVPAGGLLAHSEVCPDGRCGHCDRRGHISSQCKIKEYEGKRKRSNDRDGSDRKQRYSDRRDDRRRDDRRRDDSRGQRDHYKRDSGHRRRDDSKTDKKNEHEEKKKQVGVNAVADKDDRSSTSSKAGSGRRRRSPSPYSEYDSFSDSDYSD